MKRLVLTCLTALLISMQLMAQAPQQQQQFRPEKFSPEKFQAELEQYITKEACLTLRSRQSSSPSSVRCRRSSVPSTTATDRWGG